MHMTIQMIIREWNLEKTLRDALRDITSFVFEILLIKYVLWHVPKKVFLDTIETTPKE